LNAWHETVEASLGDGLHRLQVALAYENFVLRVVRSGIVQRVSVHEFCESAQDLVDS
jgi:hypothetical protein